MPPIGTPIRNAEHASDSADRTADASANRAANCATHRPRRAMTLVRALVGTALHTAEDALRMRLMRKGKQGQRCGSSDHRDPQPERRFDRQC